MDHSFPAAGQSLTAETHVQWFKKQAQQSGVQDITALRGEALIRFAHRIYGTSLSVLSAFGNESAVLLALVAAVDKNIRVIFIDTEKLFPETLTYKDQLVAQLGLTNIQTIKPDPVEIASEDPTPANDLWQRARLQCCDLRKVRPLDKALAEWRHMPTVTERLTNPLAQMMQATGGKIALLNGNRRGHGRGRNVIHNMTVGESRADFSPLYNFTSDEIAALFQKQNLPAHPLATQFPFGIGCMPPACTAATGKFVGEEEAKRVCLINLGDRNSLDSAAL